MNSTCSGKFWALYNALPEGIRKEADHAYALWQSDSKAKSLHFKPVPSRPGWWSVRINMNYRALCVKTADAFVWFFIGSHDDYERLIG